MGVLRFAKIPTEQQQLASYQPQHAFIKHLLYTAGRFHPQVAGFPSGEGISVELYVNCATQKGVRDHSRGERTSLYWAPAVWQALA